MRICVLLIVLMLAMMNSFSQSIKVNVEKQVGNPKTWENAAKADVYILQNKKQIGDSATSQKRSSVPLSHRSRIQRKK